MSNYKDQSVSGSSWTRAYSITISNPLTGYDEPEYMKKLRNGRPPEPCHVVFSEEEVVVANNIAYKNNLPGLVKHFNPTESITVVNPETNIPTGQTISHADLYVYLYSLYIQTALERDAQNATS